MSFYVFSFKGYNVAAHGRTDLCASGEAVGYELLLNSSTLFLALKNMDIGPFWPLFLTISQMISNSYHGPTLMLSKYLPMRYSLQA
jgi:hypothetical protein